MRAYYYNIRNVQLMWSKWQEGEFPSHLLYGAAELEQHGIELVMHQSVNVEHRGLLMLRTAWRILRCRESYDVVYGTAFRGLELIILLRALHLFRRPIVVWHHQPIVKARNPLREAVARLFYRGIDHMFFFSEKLISDSLKSAKARPERLHLAHWGADLNFYDRIIRAHEGERKGFVATGKEMRDHTTLIKAFNRTTQVLELYVARYKGDKNPDRGIETLQTEENIHVNRTDGHLMPRTLAEKVDQAACVVICCYPTNYTVGLTTVVEALALGLPMICTRNAQMPFDIEAEGCGITVDYGDVEGWVKAIETIANDPERARQMGQRGRQLSEQTYNIAHCAAEVAEVLKQIRSATPFPITHNAPTSLPCWCVFHLSFAHLTSI